MKSSLVKPGQKFSPYKAKRNQPGSVTTVRKGASLDRILKEATLDLTKVTSVIRGQKSQFQMREDQNQLFVGKRNSAQPLGQESAGIGTSRSANPPKLVETSEDRYMKQKELPKFL